MKYLILTFVMFFNVIVFTQNAQPEFYMHVRDNPGASYKIFLGCHGRTVTESSHEIVRNFC